MDEAIALILAEFDTWEGCQMHSIRYLSDECNSDESVAWMNVLAEGRELGVTFTLCIEFKSDFHSPVEGGGAWEADQEYTDWGWYLAREDGGSWQLMTWGY